MLKEIKGFENYLISSNGEVFKKGRSKPLKLFNNSDGYNCICLYNEHGRKHKRVCRLVAEHFLDNPDNLPVVNHKNLIRDDDRVENLEWVTVAENNRHGVLNNIDAHRHLAKITKDQAHDICKYLEYGLRAKDVAEILQVPFDSVNHISKGKTWAEISSQYQLPEKSSRVSLATAKWVLKLLESGKDYQTIKSLSSNSRLSLELIKMIDENIVFKELDRPSTISRET